MAQKSYVRIPNYSIYTTNHPDQTAHGGTAVIIKNNIKHHYVGSYSENHLQATTIAVTEKTTLLNISAVYCPPKHNITKDNYLNFFQTLGNRFIAAGDFNAKHQDWGSRITRTDGRQMMKAIQEHNMNFLSTGEPTYWPTDHRKLPDLIDFCIMKGINTNLCTVESCYELAGDHSSVILTLFSHFEEPHKRAILHSRRTDWELFGDTLNNSIDLNMPLKTPEEIDNAVYTLTKHIQQSAWKATPSYKVTKINEVHTPTTIKDKIKDKRRARKHWQLNRTPENKRILNKISKELKKLMLDLKNKGIQNYLEHLSPTEATNYSLWKAIKFLKRPQQYHPPIKNKNNEWAKTSKEKALAFGEHLMNVFQPFSDEIPREKLEEVEEFLEAPFQLSLPTTKVKIKEVKATIKNEINPKKAPGFDLVTGTILQKLPFKAIKLITEIFNAIIRTGHFPNEWKVAKIIMIPKHGKPAEEITSYRPISLLPVLSKLFEKIFIKKLNKVIASDNLIPDYQFGFRNKHGTIEQIHRIVNQINADLEKKRYCSAAFLDITQAFDKVWHTGLLYKLKKVLPYDIYLTLKSYLQNRHFLVENLDECTELHPILAGVPQGSVLGPTLYLLYTADMPTTRQTLTATYADDTATLASHADPTIASQKLQTALTKIQNWLELWKIKVNESKSTHITFTNRKEDCPPITFNGQQLKHVNTVKYLGMHLDRKLNWKNHIFNKRKQLGIQLHKLYWMLGRTSRLSIQNKTLIYKVVLKPVWTYGIQLWGTTSNSNIEILQRFQNKILRMVVNAPWYVPNTVIHRDLGMLSVKEEIGKFSEKYSDRVAVHPNVLANQLMTEANPETRRLKRFKPTDLQNRFN